MTDDYDPLDQAFPHAAASKKREEKRMESSFERLIYQIEAKLDALKVNVDQQSIESRDSRKKIHQDMETVGLLSAEMKRDVLELKTGLNAMAETMEKHELAFHRFNNIEQRVLGVAWFATGIGLTSGAGLAFAWKWIASKMAN